MAGGEEGGPHPTEHVHLSRSGAVAAHVARRWPTRERHMEVTAHCSGVKASVGPRDRWMWDTAESELTAGRCSQRAGRRAGGRQSLGMKTTVQEAAAGRGPGSRAEGAGVAT